MVFLVPPFQAPDEVAHYYRSSGVSEGELLCSNQDFWIEGEKLDFVNAMKVEEIIFQPDENFNRKNIKNYRDSGVSTQEKCNPVICHVSFFGNMISGFGIFLGNLLNFNELNSFYIGRIFNLLFAVSVTACAIKTIPFGKMLLFFLGLLPTTIFMFASLNYDAIIIPLIFLWIAIFLKNHSDRVHIQFLTWVLLVSILVVILSVKIVYLPLAFLILIFAGKPYVKKPMTALLWLIVVIGISLLGLFLGKNMVSQPLDASLFNPGKQIEVVLQEPFSFVIILLKSIVRDISVNFIHVIGILGWIDYRLHDISYIVAVIWAILTIIKSNVKVSWKLSILTMVIFLMNLSLIYLSMFVFATKVGGEYITGVQGRYLTSVLPLVYVSAVGLWGKLAEGGIFRRISLKRNSPHISSFLFLPLIFWLIIDTIWVTLIRYYL